MNDAFWTARKDALKATAMVAAWSAAAAKPNVDMKAVEMHIEYWVFRQVEAEHAMGEAETASMVNTMPSAPAPAPSRPTVPEDEDEGDEDEGDEDDVEDDEDDAEDDTALAEALAAPPRKPKAKPPARPAPRPRGIPRDPVEFDDDVDQDA
jgi:hypothetical protein